MRTLLPYTHSSILGTIGVIVFLNLETFFYQSELGASFDMFVRKNLMIAAVLVMFLNLFISLWNSYVTGKVWVEACHAGGERRFMARMGYLMASLGFTEVVVLWVGLLLQGRGSDSGSTQTLFKR